MAGPSRDLADGESLVEELLDSGRVENGTRTPEIPSCGARTDEPGTDALALVGASERELHPCEEQRPSSTCT